MKEKNIELSGKAVLITGAAGFIGACVAKKILNEQPDAFVVGIDNMNDYYDVNLKRKRLAQLEKYANFAFVKGNIANRTILNNVVDAYCPSVVVHLAAQAGAKYSIERPEIYMTSNMMGFFNVLEACRHSYDYGAMGVRHLLYASSWSVYGENKKAPFSVDDKADCPVSLYAATKKSNELMAYAYAKLYGIPSTGIRFFTVYGPAGRPDAEYFIFAEMLRQGKKIQLNNYGESQLNLTYIDDIVEGVYRAMLHAPVAETTPDGLTTAPYALYNMGNSCPNTLQEVMEVLCQELIRTKVLPENFNLAAHIELVPLQAGEISAPYSDVAPLQEDFGYEPSTSLEEGLRAFAEWYAEYSKHKK